MIEVSKKSRAKDQRIGLVGYSAAEFAAIHDSSLRSALINAIWRRDPFNAIELVVRRAWWNEFNAFAEQVVLTDVLIQSIAFELRSSIVRYPVLLKAVATSSPQFLADSICYGDPGDDLPELWNALKAHIHQLSASQEFNILNILLQKALVSAEYVAASLDRRQSEVPELATLSDIDGFSELLLLLIERLPLVAAKAAFERFVNYDSIASSSVGYAEESHEFVFHGPRSLYDCGNAIANKMGLSNAIAWASRILIEAHIISNQQWSLPFNGTEIAGSGHSMMGNSYTYQDSGWMLRVLLPLQVRRLKNAKVRELKKILKAWSSFSALHSAFRLRTIILALSKIQIGKVSKELLELSVLAGGIPSVADVIARRSKDSSTLAAAFIRDRIARYGTITNPDEASVLHQLISENYPGARQMALATVRHESFRNLENFHLGFISQLSWAEKFPDFAVSLILAAVEAGYKIDLISSRYVVDLIRIAMKDETLRELVFGSDALKAVAGYAISDDAALYAKYALQLYRNGDRQTRMEIVRKASDAELDIAAPILRLALKDSDPSLDSSLEKEAAKKGEVSMISGIRTTAYFATYQLLMRKGQTFYANLGLDLPDIVRREAGIYGAHYGLIALGALYGVARQKKNDAILKEIMATIIHLRDLNLGITIDETLASFYVAEWSNLGVEDVAMFWRRFGQTSNAVDKIIDDLLKAFTRKSASAGVFKELVRRWSESSLDRAAWFLWRRLRDDASPYSFDSPSVQWMLDQLETRVRSESYGSLARILVDGSVSFPRLALDRLIDLSIKAIRGHISLMIYFDHGHVDFAKASPEKVLELGECILSEEQQGSWYGPLSFLFLLLQHVTGSKFYERVDAVYQALKEIPAARESHSAWLSRLRS